MENWTQRLLFEGCGGLCGAIHLGRVTAADGCQAVSNGEFAVVSSDLGHKSKDDQDAVWAADKQLRIDFGYRGVHVTTVAAKEIIARFYGQPQAFAYFSGCSDGGREAMMEAERFPSDYNGILAGAAVMNKVTNDTVYHAWNIQHLRRADGTNVFSEAALATLHNAAIAACGDKRDALIPDPTLCHFDPDVIACKSGEPTDACLTSTQVKAARDLYIGAQGPDGHPLYFGYEVGSELAWNRQLASDIAWGVGAFPGFMASDPPDLKAEMTNVVFTPEAVSRMTVFAAQLNATNYDLRPFQKAGGKLIMWHGWDDIGVAPRSWVTFFRDVQHAGLSADTFLRLYMLPGVAHCSGGAGPDRIDAMSAIMAWVENGVAPGPIAAKKKDATGKIISERLIQPYR
jgi:feruloyl esterase